MKRLLLILILTFSFQNLTKADDIGDFEIEGISIGDSLLDFFTKKDIKKQYYPKSKKYVWTWHNNLLSSSKYDGFRFHYDPNDKNYSLSVYIYLKNDMKSCLEKQKKIIDELDNLFVNAKKKPISDKMKHPSDPSGKSLYTYADFKLTNGKIAIECTNWSKKIENKYNWVDNLSIMIQTTEFSDWLRYDAR
jgi:hypothetical protein